MKKKNWKAMLSFLFALVLVFQCTTLAASADNGLRQARLTLAVTTEEDEASPPKTTALSIRFSPAALIWRRQAI